MAATKAEVGYYAPSGLDLLCGGCGATDSLPNPQHMALMPLILKAEKQGWHVPFGGKVLCPACQKKVAHTLGRETLSVTERRHTHEALASGLLQATGRLSEEQI
jgi:hypothetical protein